MRPSCAHVHDQLAIRGAVGERDQAAFHDLSEGNQRAEGGVGELRRVQHLDRGREILVAHVRERRLEIDLADRRGERSSATGSACSPTIRTVPPRFAAAIATPVDGRSRGLEHDSAPAPVTERIASTASSRPAFTV